MDTTIPLALLGATVLFLLLLCGSAVAWYVIRLKRESPITVPSPALVDFAARLGRLEAVVSGLPSVWEEAVKKSVRSQKAAENKLAQAEKIHREVLEEFGPESDDESAEGEVPRGDAPGGTPSQLQLLSDAVDGPPEDPADAFRKAGWSPYL